MKNKNKFKELIKKARKLDNELCKYFNLRINLENISMMNLEGEKSEEKHIYISPSSIDLRNITISNYDVISYISKPIKKGSIFVTRKKRFRDIGFNNKIKLSDILDK